MQWLYHTNPITVGNGGTYISVHDLVKELKEVKLADGTVDLISQ